MAMELVTQLPYDHPYRWDGSAFGGPILWRPNALGSNLALWLDAEDSSTITLNGATVSQWSDKSGNGRNVSQAVAASQPTYNSNGWNSTKPTLTFNGTSSSLPLSEPINITRNISAFSIFAVMQRTGGNSYGAIFGNVTSISNQARAVLYGRSGTVEAGGRRLDANSYQFVSSSQSGLGLASAEFDYGNAELRVGVNGTYTARAGGFQTAGSTSDTNSANGGVGLTGSVEYFGGNISEIVAVQKILSTSERRQLEGYLAWKWGLQASLPVSHPYYNLPPTV